MEVSDVAALKMYRKEIGKEVLRKTGSRFPFIEVEITVVIENSGLRVIEIPLNHNEPETRHFMYIFRSVVCAMADIVVNYFKLRKRKI